jgi:hypothetical protein
MKKVNSLAIVFLLSLVSLSAGAQTKGTVDFFAGKWNVLVKGTPSGDSRMLIVLDKKDVSLAGVVQDSLGVEIAKIDKIEAGAKEPGLIVYFNSHGYDVNVELSKKDDDHVIGSLMGMFDAEGERIKKQ